MPVDAAQQTVGTQGRQSGKQPSKADIGGRLKACGSALHQPQGCGDALVSAKARGADALRGLCV
jgi:hypothetical protein